MVKAFPSTVKYMLQLTLACSLDWWVQWKCTCMKSHPLLSLKLVRKCTRTLLCTTVHKVLTAYLQSLHIVKLI